MWARPLSMFLQGLRGPSVVRGGCRAPFYWRGKERMRKQLLKAGLCIVAALLTGAVAVGTVDKLIIEPKVISTWSDLYSAYNSRADLPPLPDFEPLSVYKMIQVGDWSFMTNHWSRLESGGTFYVSKDSKELQNLKLPLTIRIYDYLPTRETYILSSQDGEKFKSEAAFKSEPLTDDLFAGLTTDKQAHELLFSIWRKRVVWEIKLKSEDAAWEDLITTKSMLAASSTLSLDGGEMMAMRAVPAEHVDDIWLALETQTNGINLEVYAPDGFTNRVEVYSCADLVSGFWTVAGQNLYPSTNPAVWDASSTLTNRFLRAGNMDIDSDEDGLPDAREVIVHKTDPGNADSDGDTLSDSQELSVYLTNPNSTDTDNDGLPDGWEVANSLNPLVDDAGGNPDSDDFANLQEYLLGRNPQAGVTNDVYNLLGLVLYTGWDE